MLVDLLKKVLKLELETALELKAKLSAAQEANSELQTLIDGYIAQDVIDAENSTEVSAAIALVKSRLAELEAINPSPVADAIAEEINQSETVETPDAIEQEIAIGTSEPTPEETIEIIAETVPELVEPEEQRDVIPL